MFLMTPMMSFSMHMENPFLGKKIYPTSYLSTFGQFLGSLANNKRFAYILLPRRSDGGISVAIDILYFCYSCLCARYSSIVTVLIFVLICFLVFVYIRFINRCLPLKELQRSLIRLFLQ